jgi:hypothetical protein
MAKRVEKAQPPGLLDTLKGFGRLLQEMQGKGTRKWSGSGRTIVAPDLVADYRYDVRLGIEPRDFFRPKRYRAKTEEIRRRN